MSKEIDELEVQKELEKKRENIKTFDELVAYLKDVEENYNTGYGVTPRAIAQACLAVAWHLSEVFGITGFQASFVPLLFIKGWNLTDNKCGFKVIDYDNFLYPQCKSKFEKTISEDLSRATPACSSA